MELADVIYEIIKPYRKHEESIPKGISHIVVNEELVEIYRELCKNSHSVELPYIINVSGLPASGKSCYIKELIPQHPEAVYISFDLIMESWSGYKNDVQQVGKEKAFSNWEIPARVAGYELMQFCVKHKYNIIFEHSNANKWHVELYQALQLKGYRVEIRFIDAQPQLVLPRLAARDRHFPPESVISRWNLMQQLLPQYQKIANSFEVVEAWREK